MCVLQMGFLLYKKKENFIFFPFFLNCCTTQLKVSDNLKKKKT